MSVNGPPVEICHCTVGAGYPPAAAVKVALVPTQTACVTGLVVTTGASLTVSVKSCDAGDPTPFVAVKVIEYVPPLPAAGVPPSTNPLNVTPFGSGPLSTIVGAGKPVAMTGKPPFVPTVNVVLFALVIAGAALTVSVKGCPAFGPAPFDAIKLMKKLPDCVGVPERTPLAALNVTPVGSAPLSLSVGAGNPVVVTLNDPATPRTNAVELALVIAGA